MRRSGGRRLRFAIDGGRPPVEQQQAVAIGQENRLAERGVEQFRGGAEVLAEVERLAEADQQVDAGRAATAPPAGRH